MKSAAIALLLSGTAMAGELTIHTGSWHSEREYWTGQYQRVGYDWDYFAQTGALTFKMEEIRRPHNNTNYGLGYTTDQGWTFGIYRNSYYQTSVYGGKAWSWKVGPTLLGGRQAEVGVMAALATGYRREGKNSNYLQPAAGLTLGIPLTKRATLRFIGAPQVTRDMDSVVHMTIAYRL